MGVDGATVAGISPLVGFGCLVDELGEDLADQPLDGRLDRRGQRRRDRRDRLRAEVAGLQAEIDSLRSDKKILTTDNKRLEHIAREEFGMVKGEKEILYWTTRDNDASGNRVLRDSSGATGVSRDTLN